MSGHVEIISERGDYRFVESVYDLASPDHFWFRWRLEAFLRQLSDLGISPRDEMHVLDVGSGTGVLRHQLESNTNWSVDITDLDISALERSSPGRGRTIYYDISERRPDWSEKYDAILIFDVLEHIDKTGDFIESLLFHLKRGGYLFINVPALQVLFSRFDEIQGHFRRYRRKTLTGELSGFPVEIRDVRYWGLANVPSLLVRRFLLKMFCAGKSAEEIFRDGFSAPAFVNRMFHYVMRTEMFMTSKPFVGSSILLAARKL